MVCRNAIHRVSRHRLLYRATKNPEIYRLRSIRHPSPYRYNAKKAGPWRPAFCFSYPDGNQDGYIHITIGITFS